MSDLACQRQLHSFAQHRQLHQLLQHWQRQQRQVVPASGLLLGR
jgi:hypothetical protein